MGTSKAVKKLAQEWVDGRAAKALDSSLPGVAAQPLKVAIVGGAPSSRDLAPFKDETWEIWGCSPSNRNLPRVTAWFEIHALADHKSAIWERWNKPYIEWMREHPRVYMQEKDELVPNALLFPIREIVAWARHGSLFLTSSISLQLAYAMMLGATEIGIYGVDMAADSEFDYERPGCKYWIAEARAAGIKVYVPPQSDLDQPAPIYGIDDGKPEAVRAKVRALELQDRMDALQRRANEIELEKQGIDREYNRLAGALGMLNGWRKTYISASGPDLR